MNNDRGRFTQSSEYIKSEAVLSAVKTSASQLLELWAMVSSKNITTLQKVLSSLDRNPEILLELPDSIQKQVKDSTILLPNLAANDARQNILNTIKLAIEEVLTKLEDQFSLGNASEAKIEETSFLTQEKKQVVLDNSTQQNLIALIKDPHLLESLSNLQDEEFKIFSKMVDDAKELRQKINPSPKLGMSK